MRMDFGEHQNTTLENRLPILGVSFICEKCIFFALKIKTKFNILNSKVWQK